MCLLNVRPSASFRDCDAARKPKQLPTPAIQGLKAIFDFSQGLSSVNEALGICIKTY